MVEQSVERKLLAVLVADVAGFSRLMRRDEEGTPTRFELIRRQLLEPTVSRHRRRIIKYTGDGALVAFASVVDAVRCAVELQRNMVDRNSDVPDVDRMQFRIGINLGDVCEEQDCFPVPYPTACIGKRPEMASL